MKRITKFWKNKYEEELGRSTANSPNYRQGLIDPNNITVNDQNTLRRAGYVPVTDYQGWIYPNNNQDRQQVGLKTEDEINTQLDQIAQKLGLGEHNNLTDDNLANLWEAQKERNHARNALQTNDLNYLPQIPEGETLQTLLERPTKQEKDEAVNSARQQEIDRYKNHIDPANRTKLEEVAKKAGFGFTQKDIDEAVQKERDKYTHLVDPTTYRVSWIDPDNLIKDYDEKKTVLENKVNILRKELEEKKNDTRRLEDKLDKEGSNEELENQLASARKEKETRRKQLQEAEKDLKDLNTQISKFSEQKRQSQIQISPK